VPKLLFFCITDVLFHSFCWLFYLQAVNGSLPSKIKKAAAIKSLSEKSDDWRFWGLNTQICQDLYSQPSKDSSFFGTFFDKLPDLHLFNPDTVTVGSPFYTQRN